MNLRLTLISNFKTHIRYEFKGFSIENNLVVLPKSLSNLAVLKSLDLSNNQIAFLDENLFRISSLEYLVATGNRHSCFHNSVQTLK